VTDLEDIMSLGNVEDLCFTKLIFLAPVCKMKVTPFLNFHIPQTKSAVIPEDKPTSRSTVMDEQPIVMST
jgi:hypothetical protein